MSSVWAIKKRDKNVKKRINDWCKGGLNLDNCN